ncbi:alpha/beta fold hydrolase [Candidatus Woesearchaeota archaeon]|nr:alpha/beta fold hydrolase [Candidatus Woesearchaeota archaeon]
MSQKIVRTKILSSKGKLSAVIHYPKSESQKLAILCPGYLDSKDYQHLVGLAEVLNNIRYTVVRFDPTGTWESEGTISDYTNSQYIEDIKNVLEFMLNRKRYEYVLLGGHSRGGQLSIIYAARDRRISLVVAIMPSSKHTMTGQRYKDWERTGVSISYRDLPENKDDKREFRVPFSHVRDREKYDVMGAVKKIKVPIIVAAGELDEFCLPKHVKEIFDNANQPKQFVMMPCISHDYRHNESEVKFVNQEILKLMQAKVILVDAVDTFVIEDKGKFKIFKEMYDLLEAFPNRKIILTGANDEQIIKFGLDKMPYEVFTLKHNPEKTEPKYFKIMLRQFWFSKDDVIYFEHNPPAVKSAESAGIKAYYYDSEKRDLKALKTFLSENV